MDKQALMRELFEANLTGAAIVWLGAEDLSRPSRVLSDWFEDEEIDGLPVEFSDRGDDMSLINLIDSQWSSRNPGFVAEFRMAVPRNIQFDDEGRPKSWSVGSGQYVRIFHRPELEDCYKAALQWAKEMFDEAINKARESAAA